jgi:hypothetical protein
VTSLLQCARTVDQILQAFDQVRRFFEAVVWIVAYSLRVTLTPNAEEVHPELSRARQLMAHGRLRAAARACAQVVKDEPDNARALALKARLDAATHVIPVEQAQGTIEALITLHPDDTYLQVASSVLLVKGKDRSAAIAALRRLSDDNPSDAYIHQVLAGLLGCQKSTWDEALVHYKLALAAGPLLTPGYRAAAYYLAKRKDPEMTERALAGAGALERASIRSRSHGPRIGFLALMALLVPAMLLRYFGDTGWSVLLLALVSIWCGWTSVANAVVGCWKCATGWLVMIAVGWGALAIYQPHSEILIWVAVAFPIGGLVGLVSARRSGSQGGSTTDQNGPSEQKVDKRRWVFAFLVVAAVVSFLVVDQSSSPPTLQSYSFYLSSPGSNYVALSDNSSDAIAAQITNVNDLGPATLSSVLLTGAPGFAEPQLESAFVDDSDGCQGAIGMLSSLGCGGGPRHLVAGTTIPRDPANASYSGSTAPYGSLGRNLVIVVKVPQDRCTVIAAVVVTFRVGSSSELYSGASVSGYSLCGAATSPAQQFAAENKADPQTN